MVSEKCPLIPVNVVIAQGEPIYDFIIFLSLPDWSIPIPVYFPKAANDMLIDFWVIINSTIPELYKCKLAKLKNTSSLTDIRVCFFFLFSRDVSACYLSTAQFLLLSVCFNQDVNHHLACKETLTRTVFFNSSWIQKKSNMYLLFIYTLSFINDVNYPLYVSLNIFICWWTAKCVQRNGKTTHQPKANSMFGWHFNKVLHDPAEMLSTGGKILTFKKKISRVISSK